MGSCVSAPKNSAVKLAAFGSNHPNPGIPAPSFGAKEETFFDSQPWLESDCEDDFFSVNGDFTPSRGNTPIHLSFSVGTPQPNKLSLEERQSPSSVSAPSPKKKLVEFFKDSLDEDQEDRSETKKKIMAMPARSAPGTPFVSVPNSSCSSERTVNGDSVKKDKAIRPAHGCIPRLVTCSSFTERRRKMSPAVA